MDNFTHSVQNSPLRIYQDPSIPDSSGKCYLTEVPHEIIYKIFEWLTITPNNDSKSYLKGIIRLSATCKTLRADYIELLIRADCKISTIIPNQPHCVPKCLEYFTGKNKNSCAVFLNNLNPVEKTNFYNTYKSSLIESAQSIKLKKTTEHAFQMLRLMKRIGLCKKSLTIIQKNAFHGLKNLEVIDLAHNQLTTLPENVFQGLQSLYFIDLSHNQLTTLPENLFQGLQSLRIIDLSHNQLIIIPESAFQGIPENTTVDLSHNTILTWIAFKGHKKRLVGFQAVQCFQALQSLVSIETFQDLDVGMFNRK